MGELHLEIIVDRMRREFKVEANVGKPQVAYRETLTAAVEQDYRHVKQTGGHGQYAHVRLIVEPNQRGKGFQFTNKIVGGVIPREFFPAIEKGVEAACNRGVIAGYPLVDVKATLIFGSFHEVDSSAMAFEIAASMCFREAAQRAKPILLEPIMQVEVVTPDDYMGAVIGDLNARRGKVLGMDSPGTGIQVINADVPLATMFGYSTELRSASQGRATYTMQFAHYAPVPAALADLLVAKVRGL
jgi:elongation factor G